MKPKSYDVFKALEIIKNECSSEVNITDVKIDFSIDCNNKKGLTTVTIYFLNKGKKDCLSAYLYSADNMSIDSLIVELKIKISKSLIETKSKFTVKM